MKGLMVLTSHDQLGNTVLKSLKTGFWLEEGAALYFVYRDADVQLALVSPKGGEPLRGQGRAPLIECPEVQRDDHACYGTPRNEHYNLSAAHSIARP